MKINCMPVGYLHANCYILSDETSKLCAVIDPGGNAEKILAYLDENALKCSAILLTHAHDDHSKGVYGVKDATGAKLYMHKGDVGLTVRRTGLCFQQPEDTVFVSEGDGIDVGALHIKVIETPGHTPGGLCFLCGDALFSGDTLFKGSTGRASDHMRDSSSSGRSSFMRLSLSMRSISLLCFQQKQMRMWHFSCSQWSVFHPSPFSFSVV